MRREQKRKHRRTRILVSTRSEPDALIDSPAEDERWVHDQLLRWAEWCRPGRVPNRSQSAEGRYVAPKANVYNPPEPRLMYSVEEAKEVNAALLDLMPQNRLLLVMRYHEKKPDLVICREFKLKHNDYQRTMRNARLMLHNALLVRKSSGTITTYNSTIPVTFDANVDPDGRDPHSEAAGKNKNAS